MKAVSVLSLAALVPAAGWAQAVISARPGTLNYVEGSASLGGDQTLTGQSVGKTQLGAGQTLETTDGKAEVLLTPGVYLRMAADSRVRMVSPDLTRTEVALEHGRAEVEVDELYKQNNLLVDVGPTQVRLGKQGLYEISAEDAEGGASVRVFDGKAEVRLDGGEKTVDVKRGHVLPLTGEADKAEGFNEKKYDDPLTDWSNLRSDYLGRANQQIASQYADNGGAGGYAPGWAWSPGLYGYTYLPGNGLFFSPFGYGFYSAPYLFGGGYVYPGFYGGGLYGGLYGGGYYTPGRYYNGAGSGGRHVPGVPITSPLNHGSVASGPAGRPVNGNGFHTGAPNPGGALHGDATSAGGYRGGGAPSGGFHGGGGGSMAGGGMHGGGGAGGGSHR